MPENPKLQVFAFLHDRLGFVPKPIRRGAKYLLLGVSPEVPISLTDGVKGVSLGRVFAHGFLIAFALSFGVIAAWTAINGTLWGSDPRILYFLQDYPNLLNYTVLVPSYVGLGSVLLTCVLFGWSDLRRVAKPKEYSGWALTIVAFLSVSVAAIVTANYMNEILSPEVYRQRYWFVQGETDAGLRAIGGLGVYYAILNFVLLCFTLVCMSAFFAMFRMGLEVGDHFASKKEIRRADREHLRAQLSWFTRAYIVSKLLIAVYMLNAYTWKWEQPEGSLNLVLMGGVLTIMALALVAVPRYYIELNWHRLKSRSEGLAPEVRDNYHDIRPANFQLWAHALDVLILGGFATSFWFS